MASNNGHVKVEKAHICEWGYPCWKVEVDSRVIAEFKTCEEAIEFAKKHLQLFKKVNEVLVYKIASAYWVTRR